MDKVTPVSDEEWETVVEQSGTPIDFSNPGDQFVGVYDGVSVIEFDDPKEGPKSFKQYRFTDTENLPRVLNGTYKLDEAFEEAGELEGKTVRITFVGTLDVGQPSPMRDFKIEVKKA